MSSDVNRQRSTILVVEDSPLVLSLITAVLVNEGYEVVTAASAESALSTLSTLPEPPVLIISDLRLGPGLGGLKFLQQALAACPARKGMLMSGAFDEQPHAYQPFSILAKPFDPETLLSLVTRLINAS